MKYDSSNYATLHVRNALSFPILSYLGSCRTRATNGNCCVFPFIYKRKRYYGCTKRNAARKWCATTPNYDRDRLWSYCRGVNRTYRKVILLIISSKWTLGSPSPLRLFPSSCSLQIPPVPSVWWFSEITKVSVNELTRLLVVLGKTDLDLRSYFHVS